MRWLLAMLVLIACTPSKTRFPKISGSLKLVTRGDTAQVFETADKAAVAACAFLREHYPDARRYEFAGCIFQDSQGIKVGLPETIGDPGWCKTPDPPLGTILLADYHSHLLTEVFSSTDLNTHQKTLKYLCTPSGLVLRHDPQNGATVSITP